jgi:hypothetical protein
MHMRMLLPGDAVQLTLSDPWDFVTSCGSGPFRGKVLRFFQVGDLEQLLVEMSSDIAFGGRRCQHIVIKPRHCGHSLLEADPLTPVPCNATGLSRAQATSENPFEFHPHQALLRLIGSLSRVRQD